MSSSSGLRRTLLAALASWASGATAGGNMLAELQALPQRGQTSEQARRDRYECHEWAVQQTGVMPMAERSHELSREAHAERVDRVVTGAVTGASLGGLLRSIQGKNPSHGILAGAALGAVVGAATGRAHERAAYDAQMEEYLRALSACLQGRGYRLTLPGAEASVAASNGSD